MIIVVFIVAVVLSLSFYILGYSRAIKDIRIGIKRSGSINKEELEKIIDRSTTTTDLGLD